jgi:serine/threonine-protein kinase
VAARAAGLPPATGHVAVSPPVDRARVYRVFLAALDLPPAAQALFLDQECGGNALMRAEVAALLDVAARDSAATAALLGTPDAPEADLCGTTVGRFRLVERIGQGGMGVVYRAERTDGVAQSVAVKIVATHLALAGRARLAREARHLARLEHPCVSRLIDAGVDQGQPWIAMEFVRGERIDTYCDSRGLGVRERLALLVQIAGAVVAAHRMLVVHADIKPGNVLVDDSGAPKLIDFGISMVLRDSGVAAADTQNLGRLFSPGYAAPEQVQGGPLTVATDVFGLGALAYRLLTGVPIFAEAADPLAYVHSLATRALTVPSRAAAANPRAPVAAALLRGDLDAILCKALAGDAARRYATAAELQDDLRRYLALRPVRARQPVLSYRLGKFLRRNALAASLGAVLLGSLAIAGGFLQWQSQRAAVARDMAARRGEFLEELLKSADPRGGRRDVSVAELLGAAVAGLDRKLGKEPLVEASMLGLIAQTYFGLGRYDDALAVNERQRAILAAGGGSALDIAQAIALQADLLRSLGRWSDAAPVSSDAVARLRRLRAPAALCAALNVQAAVLLRSGHEKDGEAALREALAIEGPGGAQLSDQRRETESSLAVLLGEQDRATEAAGFGADALALARAQLPADHPDLLNIEGHYAVALTNLGRGAEAEPLFRDVIATQTRVLGAGHKDTLLTQYAYMEDLHGLHRDADAAALAQVVARGLEAAVGPDNVYTLGAWMNFGIASCAVHPDAGALAVLRKVEAARRRTYPPGSWFIDSAALNVGACLIQLHRYDAAAAVLRPAVAGLEASKGATFHRTQVAYGLLRDLCRATGKGSEAQAWAAKMVPGTGG